MPESLRSNDSSLLVHTAQGKEVYTYCGKSGVPHHHAPASPTSGIIGASLGVI